MTTPKVVSVIPARGGSKGVARKNLERIGGISLVARTVLTALEAELVERVYVSTDDADIAEAAKLAGADVIIRPTALASDSASSEDALLHACETIEKDLGHQPTVLLFMQATSPFTAAENVDMAVRRVLDGSEDVVFSALETYEFLWRDSSEGVVGANHDQGSRPRRQDREPHFRETGGFYALRWSGFLAARFRFFGRIGIQRVDAVEAMEVDSYADLEIARAVSNLAPSTEPRQGLGTVLGLVMDFDGVHTDDTAILGEDGSESVRVSRSDGFGLASLREIGIEMLILSQERNTVVSARAVKLGVPCLQATDDKASAVMQWLAQKKLPAERVAYVGNDVNDISAMRVVGWPIAVQEAHPLVLREARVVLNARGGRGALRELADSILNARRGEPR